MSPGIPPMNDVALLRNLSKSNGYDVAQQHSDDKEYDDEGNPLATVVEGAINDDDEGNHLATVFEDAINDDDDGGVEVPSSPTSSSSPSSSSL
jgi:hypothetical protein